MKLNRSFLERPLVLVGLLVLARLVFIVCMPSTWSFDVYCWLDVAQVMRDGGNPYSLTPHLHTAPLWPAVLYVLDRASEFTGVSLIRCLQGLLIAVDAINLLLVLRMLSRSDVSGKWIKPVLLGLVLSPISILLTVQHGNFDALVALWLLLFLGALWSHHASGSRRSWLLACFFLGMGVFTKTVPLLHAPLLLAGSWPRKIPTALLGLLILIGPTVIGLVPLYLADAPSVRLHVLGYRSLAGWFGITGLLPIVGLDRLAQLYARVGPLVLMTLMALAALRNWKREPLDRITALRLALALLLSIVVLGPGYSPQYIGWFLPLLVLLYLHADAVERRTLAMTYLIGTCTYLVEYALIPSHGAFLLHWTSAPTLVAWSEALNEPGVQTILRIPLFLTYLVVLITIVRPLFRQRANALSISPDRSHTPSSPS